MTVSERHVAATIMSAGGVILPCVRAECVDDVIPIIDHVLAFINKYECSGWTWVFNIGGLCPGFMRIFPCGKAIKQDRITAHSSRHRKAPNAPNFFPLGRPGRIR